MLDKAESQSSGMINADYLNYVTYKESTGRLNTYSYTPSIIVTHFRLVLHFIPPENVSKPMVF